MMRKVPLQAKFDFSKTLEGRIMDLTADGAYKRKVNARTLINYMCNPVSYFLVTKEPDIYTHMWPALQKHWEAIVPWATDVQNALEVMVGMAHPAGTVITWDMAKAFDLELKDDPLRMFFVWADVDVTPAAVREETDEPSDEDTHEPPKGYIAGEYIRSDHNWEMFTSLRMRGPNHIAMQRGMQLRAWNKTTGEEIELAVESVGTLWTGAGRTKKCICARMFVVDNPGDFAFIPLPWGKFRKGMVLPGEFNFTRYKSPGRIADYQPRLRVQSDMPFVFVDPGEGESGIDSESSQETVDADNMASPVANKAAKAVTQKRAKTAAEAGATANTDVHLEQQRAEFHAATTEHKKMQQDAADATQKLASKYAEDRATHEAELKAMRQQMADHKAAQEAQFATQMAIMQEDLKKSMEDRKAAKKEAKRAKKEKKAEEQRRIFAEQLKEAVKAETDIARRERDEATKRLNESYEARIKDNQAHSGMQQSALLTSMVAGNLNSGNLREGTQFMQAATAGSSGGLRALMGQHASPDKSLKDNT